jgi:hypothetical protein
LNKIIILASSCLLTLIPTVFAAVDFEQAEKLNATLTPLGAEMAGNADGSIPAWSNNVTLTSSDAVYVTNPLSNETVLYSITKENMANYEDKLSVGTKKLLTTKDGFRMDVYKTMRTATAPDVIYKNTRINAENTTLINDGLTLDNWKAGVPFPIPQNGSEAIWNHLVRWLGFSSEGTSTAFYVDAKGNSVEASTQFVSFSSPAYTPGEDWGENNEEWIVLRANFVAPARRAGEITLVRDPIDFSEGNGRKAWQYLAGQRRVRRAPSVGFDTPAPATAGNSTYDDVSIYNGSPERFNWELIGKQECYIPYNNWRTTNVEEQKPLLTPNYFNPEAVRWELHRCWVVEATLKEDSRHIYGKRRYYLDEDTWSASMGDLYDTKGEFWRANFSFTAFNYMTKSFTSSGGGIMYDFQSGIYSVGLAHPYTATGMKEPKDPQYYTPAALKRSGTR